ETDRSTSANGILECFMYSLTLLATCFTYPANSLSPATKNLIAIMLVHEATNSLDLLKPLPWTGIPIVTSFSEDILAMYKTYNAIKKMGVLTPILAAP